MISISGGTITLFRFDRGRRNSRLTDSQSHEKVLRSNSHHSRSGCFVMSIRLPRRSLGEGERSFVIKKSWRPRFNQVREKFRLTPTEKRVAVFVLAAFVLGLVTKCSRDTHPAPPLPRSSPGKTRPAASTGVMPGKTPVAFNTPAGKRTPKSRRSEQTQVIRPTFEREHQ
jgi:hypothetical protein